MDAKACRARLHRLLKSLVVDRTPKAIVILLTQDIDNLVWFRRVLRFKIGNPLGLHIRP